MYFVQGSKPMDLGEVREIEDVHKGGISLGLGDEGSPALVRRGEDGPGHIFGFTKHGSSRLLDESERSARRR